MTEKTKATTKRATRKPLTTTSASGDNEPQLIKVLDWGYFGCDYRVLYKYKGKKFRCVFNNQLDPQNDDFNSEYIHGDFNDLHGIFVYNELTDSWNQLAYFVDVYAYYDRKDDYGIDIFVEEYHIGDKQAENFFRACKKFIKAFYG